MGVSEPYEPGQTPVAVVPVKEEVKASSSGGWFGGLAGSLRGSLPAKSGESRRGLPPPGTYKIGEVKAEYVKVCHFNVYKVSQLTYRMPRDSIHYYH